MGREKAKCHVCGFVSGHRRRHIYSCHLPVGLQPEGDPKEVALQLCGWLWQCSVFMEVESPYELFNLCVSKGLIDDSVRHALLMPNRPAITSALLQTHGFKKFKGREEDLDDLCHEVCLCRLLALASEEQRVMLGPVQGEEHDQSLTRSLENRSNYSVPAKRLRSPTGQIKPRFSTHLGRKRTSTSSSSDVLETHSTHRVETQNLCELLWKGSDSRSFVSLPSPAAPVDIGRSSRPRASFTQDTYTNEWPTSSQTIPPGHPSFFVTSQTQNTGCRWSWGPRDQDDRF